MNIFLTHKRSLKTEEINNLIIAILVKTGKFNRELLKNDFYWFDILDETDMRIKNIIEFYKNILDDRHYKIENKVKSNKDKFVILMKWTYQTFFEKIEELKTKRKSRS